jgi:hypothetical protein
VLISLSCRFCRILLLERHISCFQEFELTYGGCNHCFDFVRTKLINGNKLKLVDLTNMHDVRGRIDNFIEHCHMHRLWEDINNKLMLQLVHCKLINPHQLIGLYQENKIKPFSAKMDTISVIVEWLTRKITAIRYSHERSTKVFDPVVEIKKVNLASAEASVGQEMTPENLGVDFSSTALVTQFIDVEAEFQDEYKQGHPDNYSLEETVEDDTDSDAERLEGNVMYNRTRENSGQKKPEMQVILACPLCQSTGSTKLATLARKIRQDVNTRYKTVGKLLLCHNCFSPDHKAKYCKRPSKCRIPGCDYRHHTYIVTSNCSRKELSYNS